MDDMIISYNGLWKILTDNNTKKYQLRAAAQISSKTVAKLGKEKIVSLDILMKICETLNCNLSDICEFVKDEDNE